MTTEIEVKGLEELQRKFEKFPRVLHRAMKGALEDSLEIIWASVLPYPAPGKEPPGVDISGRQGLLGKSLGVGMSGGGEKIGKPDIYEVKPMGSGGHQEARFGTKIGYAPKVIGEQQQAPWSSYWWTMRTVAGRAVKKIVKRFEEMAAQLAAWLDDRGAEPR